MPWFCCCELTNTSVNWTAIEADSEAAARLECDAVGGCMSLTQVDGPDDCQGACSSPDTPVSCCQGEECGETTFSDCLLIGGVVSCPSGCPGGNALCGGDEFGPCCLPDGSCEIMERGDCSILAGEFRGHESSTCFDIECRVRDGFRSKQDAYWNPADKVHTTDLCEDAIFGLSKDDTFGLPKTGRGFASLMTTHEVRACRAGFNEDPCKHQHGAIVKDANGYLHPIAWSEPRLKNGATVGRWNQGVFTKQAGDDELGRVPDGYVHARVGIENRPPIELHLHTSTQRCGVDN